MKIAIFCPTVSGHGGMETAIRNLKLGLEVLGHECRLFMLGGSYDMNWLKEMRYTQIGAPTSSKFKRFTQYAFQPALEFVRWRPDAVIAADVTTMLMAVWGRAISGNWGMQIASWIHFPLRILRMKKYLHKADCHLAISAHTAKDIGEFIPSQRDRIFTIYNGTAVDRSLLLEPSRRAVFLYIGRLTFDDQKRVNDLITAAARLRGDFEIRIVGDGKEGHLERLRTLAHELGVSDKIQWHGWQEHPWSFARNASALVMTSAHEGFPMVLIESIARGLPIVSSDCVSGPGEVVETGRNGWLFPVGDIDALTDILQRIIDHPETLPSREAVFEHAQKFSVAAVAGRAVEAFRQVGKRPAV